MNYIADLHTHSAASDGQYTPAEIVALAKAKGIQVLGLTDHDTIDGIDEASDAGRAAGLTVVRGVEFSADDYLNLHILGYGLPEEGEAADALDDYFEDRKQSRSRRKFKIADYLRSKGIDIDLEEVDRISADGRVGRPHFALTMVKQGYVKTRKEAFDLYLDTPEFHEIDRGKPSAKTCVQKIKEAGGFASLAHPYQIVLEKESLEELVVRLKGYGLDAIECYYPIHTPEQTAEYLALAEKYNLHATGGSDFHGEKNKPEHPLCTWELELDWLLNR